MLISLLVSGFCQARKAHPLLVSHGWSGTTAVVPLHSFECDVSHPSGLLQTPPQPCMTPPSVPPQTPPFQTLFQGRLWPCSPWMLPVPVLRGLPPPSTSCWPSSRPSSRGAPPIPPSGGDVGPHVSPARALCSLDLITPLMHLEASVAPTACWACYVPAPQADQIPDSRAHTCPPHTEHLTLFPGDLSSRSSEAARQEWPELSATCPTAPGPASVSQVYRHVRSKAVSHVQIESLVLR